MSDLAAQLPIGIWTQAQPSALTLSAGQIAVYHLLRQFTMSAGNGEITGTGRIALRQSTLGDMALTFVAKEFRVVNTRHYNAVVSGQLTCSGSLQAPSMDR